MSINIDEIVTNMDLYKKRCFDTVACEMVDFENQDDKRYIELPEFNESDIIKAYIDINECKDLKYIKELDNFASLMDVFHKRINDLHVYDDWIRYRDNYLHNLAKKWYKDNEIYRFYK